MNWIGPAITAGMGIASSIHGNKERRKESEKNFERQKQLNEQAQELGIKTWKETNFSAQKEELKKAGLNPGLLYGMSGAGGGTVGSGGGGTAQQANIENIGMDVAGMAQLALMKAQKDNIEADTKQKEAETTKTAGVDTKASIESTRGQKFANDLNDAIGIEKMGDSYHWAEQRLSIQFEKENAEWETYKTTGYEGKSFDDKDSPIAKAMIAGWKKSITELQNAQKDLNLKEAELVIKNFEANLAKQGIHPNSPWGVKLATDLLEKSGVLQMINKWIK